MNDEKEPAFIVKSGAEVGPTSRDYRAWLSFLLTSGLIALLLKGDLQAASILGPLTGMALGWWFGKRRVEE